MEYYYLETQPSTFVVLFFVLLISSTSEGKACNYSSSCGNLRNITFPFYLKNDTSNCYRSLDYSLYCESNRTSLQMLASDYQSSENPKIHTLKYYVEGISYDEQSIRLVDPGLDGGNCSSLPIYSFNPYYSLHYESMDISLIRGNIIFVHCSDPVYNDTYYISTAPCLNGSSSQPYSYVLLGESSVSNLHPHCNVVKSTPRPAEKPRNHSYLEVHRTMLMGFDVSFDMNWYYRDYGEYYWDSECQRALQSLHCFYQQIFVDSILAIFLKVLKIIGRIMIARTLIGIFCFSIYLIYKLQRMHLSMDARIEEFLTNYQNHVPMRYSYWEIWLITKCFKEKLGQGGFGSVFKGRLINGHVVAVKMLSKNKGNGQDFINEVATIGRIHHVNVVQLIGFSSEGSKRALIYDFMPNGSLEKYIFPQEGKDNPLSWEKLYEISIGIAHGIEYLHRGCDMQILHFDIKPHNILLDQSFTPKISDFGLAKFYPTNDSIVSITAARGTIGYMAPELYYRNIGGVSYKSDVYSFGMLLMEIAGRRKNLDPFANNSSQIYFPTWIYDQLDQGREIYSENDTEYEKEIIKKLIIVALWCIQMKPTDRPSMSKVVEMLEGRVEVLEMPPKPFLSSPPQVYDENDTTNTDNTQTSNA